MNGKPSTFPDWFHSIDIHIAPHGDSIDAAIMVTKTEDGSKWWKEWLSYSPRTPEEAALFNALLPLLAAIQEADRNKGSA